MRKIQGVARNVRQLLDTKYKIGYYQREYKWEEKQITEMVADLTSRFLQDYQTGHSRQEVANYGHYFLGSIIISDKDGENYVVDGQQRLTSLTLLLIYLNNLKQQHSGKIASIDHLIFSELYAEKSFNLDVPERVACMEALYEGQTPDQNDQSESVQNIIQRYDDILQSFPDELTGDALPYFVDWLIENVHMVEITAFSDDDAYLIFETMNDRGLSLSPTDMLKSFLLASIDDTNSRNEANDRWRQPIWEMAQIGKDVPSDAIKAWLRSQHANSIRERKRGARPEDFDRIGTEFHRWVRNNKTDLGLLVSDDFFGFIEKDFHFFARQYIRLIRASRTLMPGLEQICYNAHHGFTLQNMLLLAPLTPEDSNDTIDLKLRLVAMFVDILLTWRIWNFRSIAYSTLQYAMFLVMRDIRRLEPEPLAAKLREILAKERETFATNDRLYLHQQNRWYLHRILARLTDYVGRQSGKPSRYMEYITGKGKDRYEVEHIWANKPERHNDEFPHPNDFQEYRNKFGGLLLLPKSFNASYGALPYEDKLPEYNTQNLLARSLHPQCYQRNPRFLQFVQDSGLPFQPHTEFKRADLDARYELYRAIAQRIWNPDNLLAEVAK